MLDLRKTLLISTAAISLAACATTPETQTTTTSPTDASPVSSATSPSPQTTVAANSAANPNIGNKRFAQEIQLVETLKSGKAGETTKIPVKVTNTSDFAWNSKGANPVNFAYHWLDSNGKIVVFDGERTGLAKTLAPQDSEQLNAVIKFPNTPGNYTLALTMVQEGVAWFNDVGAQPQRVPVTVQ